MFRARQSFECTERQDEGPDPVGALTTESEWTSDQIKLELDLTGDQATVPVLTRTGGTLVRIETFLVLGGRVL